MNETRISTFAPLLLTLSALVACPGSPPALSAFEDLSAELVALCPSASASDEAARDACASRLAFAPKLSTHMGDSILWGGFVPGGSIDPNDRELTRFSSFVHRKLYLSQFSFEGAGEVETIDGFTVLKMPVRFRNQMTTGAYPYPFWHSREKWDAHERATHLYFVFLGERMIAAYRVGADESRANRDPGTFDGQWRWFDELGEEQPYVSLYAWLLSDDNPYAADLDMAFRRLESAARDEACLTCHAPDNRSRMSQLVLLSFPNQALGARHDLVDVFDKNSMPPGMPLDEEALSELHALASAFARIGDDALAFEEERSGASATP